MEPPEDVWWLGDERRTHPSNASSVLRSILSGFDEDLAHSNVELAHALTSVPVPRAGRHRSTCAAPTPQPQLASSSAAGKPHAKAHTSCGSPRRGSSRRQQAEDGPEGAALLSLFLRISQPPLERDFWRSTTWWHSVRGIDRMFVLFALVNNGTLVLYHHKLTLIHFPYFNHFAVVYLAAALPLSVGATLHSPWYFKTRYLLVLLNRVVRLLHTTLLIRQLHTCVTAATCDPTTLVSTLGAGHPPPVVLVRVLAIASGTFLTILHTAYLALPLPSHALFQLTYLALSFRALALPSAHVLHHPLTLPPATALCTALHRASSAFLRFSHGLPIAPPPTSPSQICTPARAPWLLVLFCQSFFGFTVPLAIAYLLERSTKLRFLAQDAGQLHLAPAGQWAPQGAILRALVLLAVYALLCWQLVVLYHLPLLQWAGTARWHGVDDAWYYQLLAEGRAPPL